MDWLLILKIAADSGALAATAIAIFFGFRAFTVPEGEEASVGYLQRQSTYADYAGVTGALAAAAFVAGLIAL